MEPVPGLDLTQPPFDLLDDAGRARMQAGVDLGFHPAGEVVIHAGQPSDQVLVVLKGQLHAFDPDEGDTPSGHFADYGPGDILGAWAVMAGRARHSYRAQGDCLTWQIPADLFRRLVADTPAFAAYFMEGMSAKRQLVAQAARNSELTELMTAQVGDAQLAPAIAVAERTSIAQASEELRQARVDCLVVDYDEDAADPGIVTRTDLLDALTLKQLPQDAPVGPLASRPLVSVRRDEVLFQALVVMTERHIERVAVRDGERIVGTLGMAEVLAHYASHSHLISLRLARASTRAEVADAAQGMTRLVRTLHAQGARIPVLMELVSALNTRVMRKLFELVVPAQLRSGLCLLVLGSEGRREQLLKTDQDNALVMAEGLDQAAVATAMDAFAQALEEVGYPPCPGGVMACNPHWRMTQAQWRDRIDGWRMLHDAQAALDLAIALDARPVAGDAALFEPVQAAMLGLGADQRMLRDLARAILQFDTPLTLLGQVREEAGGIDLKKGGIFPIVHGLRCLALKHGLPERNSFSRCRALLEAGKLPGDLGEELPNALEVLQRLRLEAQLAALRAGAAAGDVIRPQALGRLDRELLRDTLRVAKAFRGHLQAVFHLAQ